MKRILLAFLSIILLIITSCKKNDSDIPKENEVSAYGLAIRSQGSEGADYIQQVDDLMNGEIGINNQAIEQEGWAYYTAAGNRIFSLIYGTDANTAFSYGLDNTGKLVEKGRFAFERMDVTGEADANSFVGIGSPYDGGVHQYEIMTIDAVTPKIANRKMTALYHHGGTPQLDKWPTGIAVSNGKMFVPFYQFNGATLEPVNQDTAFLTIFNYPSLDSVTVLKDIRTGTIGIYGSIPCIFKTENGDVYTVSSTSVSAGENTVKPSGMLRIKNGTTAFDQDYFMNFETAGSAKVLMASYMGNNKALVRYVPVAGDTVSNYGIYDITKDACKLAIVDVVAKTFTPLANVPSHGSGYGGYVFMENGKGYICIASNTAGEVRIYEIDPATATAKKGALIKAQEVPLIFKLTK